MAYRRWSLCFVLLALACGGSGGPTRPPVASVSLTAESSGTTDVMRSSDRTTPDLSSSIDSATSSGRYVALPWIRSCWSWTSWRGTGTAPLGTPTRCIERMDIDPHRRRYVGMAEPRAYLLDVPTLGNEGACVRVP